MRNIKGINFYSNCDVASVEELNKIILILLTESKM